MQTLSRTKTEIDYKKNLAKLLSELGGKERSLKVLKNCFGMLKGRLKKSPVQYQRELRKEWERKSVK